MSKTTEKSADQKAHEDVIVAWFAAIVITLAVIAGVATQPHSHHASAQPAAQEVTR